MKYVEKGFAGGLLLADMDMIELTRRNLLTLLAKLDGNPPGSSCTLIDPDNRLAVKAVEDEEHYANRAPGGLHPDTAAVLVPPE